MCGIVGIIGLDRGPVDPAVLQRMNDVQAHRGPDGEGYLFAAERSGRWTTDVVGHTQAWTGPVAASVGLGHRRLAILDLSDRGRQPMTVPGSGVWIIFNGEIYNHLALKAELQARGAVFATRTDTEVILEAYLRWGEACLDRLEGMFAFAIWDAARGRLFCARDRLGIKPFYYTLAGGYLLFASEIKSLLQFPGVAAAPDDDAVLGFLVHGNCDYGERTMFRRVKALPAAHALTLDLAASRLDIRQYWRLAPGAEPGHAGSDAERVDHLRHLLLETAGTHLISDVQAGSCLSGGLDSSTVVSLVGTLWREQPEAAAAIGERFHTFTACYEYPEFDERAYAGAVAGAVGATPHLVFPSAEDLWSSFACLAWHQDMPFGSPSFYAQWRVMRAAREAGVKVLLDGQGGDEVFGGYAKFRYAYLASLLRGGHVARAAAEAAGLLRQGDLYLLDIRQGYRYLPKRLRRLLGTDSLLRRILRANWDRALAAESTPATRWWRSAAGGNGASWTAMQRIQVDDLVTDTLPQLLRMEDRSSMAFSLEARVPLLDHRVVEYGLSLPDHLKVRRGWGKFAVREAMRGLMPEPVRLRRTKLSFSAPDRYWLVKDLRPQITDLIEGDLRCRAYIDPEPMRRWYRAPPPSGGTLESYRALFRVLSLEMWMRAYQIR